MQFARFSVNLKQNYYSIWCLTLKMIKKKPGFNPGYVLGNPKKPETRVDRRTGLNKNPNLEAKGNCGKKPILINF